MQGNMLTSLPLLFLLLVMPPAGPPAFLMTCLLFLLLTIRVLVCGGCPKCESAPGTGTPLDCCRLQLLLNTCVEVQRWNSWRAQAVSRAETRSMNSCKTDGVYSLLRGEAGSRRETMCPTTALNVKVQLHSASFTAGNNVLILLSIASKCYSRRTGRNGALEPCQRDSRSLVS